MHIEFLVEDASGKKLLSALLPKLLGPAHTWRIHAYKGVGHIPPNLKGTTDPNKRILLDNLPRLLQGYANTPALMLSSCWSIPITATVQPSLPSLTRW